MRVAHVDAETAFSGGEKQVLLLMRGLRARDVGGVLIAPPGSEIARRAAAEGFEVEAAPMRSDLDLLGVLTLRRLLRRLAPDLVHLHTGRAAWLGGLAARAAGLPAVVTRRMDRPVRPGIKTRLVYEGLSVRTAAISKGVAEELLAGEVHPGRVVTIPSAVDPREQRPRRPRPAVRDELGARPNDFVVLALGALVRRKGFDVLLAAVRKIQRRPLVWIAGEGPERAELERLIGGLAGRARLLGRRDDVPDLLDAADVVCVPSRAEGLGVAALEAMAAGRAVIAAEVGGLAEVVVDGRNGLLVPPEDPAALAAAIQRLDEDTALRARLGAAGLGRLTEGYLASQMVAAYQELYREVLELHGRAGA